MKSCRQLLPALTSYSRVSCCVLTPQSRARYIAEHVGTNTRLVSTRQLRDFAVSLRLLRLSLHCFCDCVLLGVVCLLVYIVSAVVTRTRKLFLPIDTRAGVCLLCSSIVNSLFHVLLLLACLLQSGADCRNASAATGAALRRDSPLPRFADHARNQCRLDASAQTTGEFRHSI